MYFGMVRFGGGTSDIVWFCGVCIGWLEVVLDIFDRRGGGVVCVLARSTSEVGIVTPYECFAGACSEGVFGVVVIVPGVFARLTCCYVRGAVRIWDGTVGVDDVWLVVVSVGAIFSAVVPFF